MYVSSNTRYSNGAYRAELTCILAIVHLSSYLCLTHTLNTPSILITCDTIKALESSFNTPIIDKISPKEKHADILSAILGLRKTKIIQFTFKQFFGHQDRTEMYEELSRESQMHVWMDRLAKLASARDKDNSIKGQS